MGNHEFYKDFLTSVQGRGYLKSFAHMIKIKDEGVATFQKLPSGKIRAQVRRGGISRGATFESKKEAERWASGIEYQAKQMMASGVVAPPKGAILADLIDKYSLTAASTAGRTKKATLIMLRKKLGQIALVNLNALHVRDFIDTREKAGAGGVTIAADLSFLSGVLKWAYYSRNLNVPYQLALDGRASLKHRKNMRTRSVERDREPTDTELEMLHIFWESNKRLKIDMSALARFALCTGMRQGEICRIRIEDIDFTEKTVIIRDRKDPSKKMGNDQTVPLLPSAWTMVLEQTVGREQGRIFPYNSASVSASFTRSCQRLGIKDLHFHDLRHKATADLFRQGLDIPFVALLTGHKTWAMLRRYTSIRAADVHKAYGVCLAG